MLTESGSSMRAAEQTARVPTKPKPRRDWSPTQNDVRIFELVKFDGQSQAQVAGGMGISQATVSRVIQRMERWQAHVEGRADGRLDPAERLRAQQWLTYERNELILGSTLRLAREMEQVIDTSSSVVHRPIGQPSAENCIVSTHGVKDRSGLVVRFLRLAFDVNMQQLKLCEQEPLPLPEPLSDEELAIEEQHAAEDAKELAAITARQQEEARRLAAAAERELAEERAAVERDRTERAEWERQIAEMQASEAELAAERAATASQQSALLGKPAVAPESFTVMHPVHNRPVEVASEIAATAGWDLGCDEAAAHEDFSGESCIRQPRTKSAVANQAAHASGLRFNEACATPVTRAGLGR